MSIKKTACGLAFVACSLGALAGSAFADASDFLGNWVNTDADNSGIARLVVTQAGSNHLNIHVFGRCKPTDCDWGVAPAHAYSGDPGSGDVQSVTADINTGFARKRITLRQAPGGALRIDVQTAFSDGSARNDYATSARVIHGVEPGAAMASGGTDATPVSSSGGFIASLFDKPATVSTVNDAGAGGGMAEDCAKLNPATSYVAPTDHGWVLRDFSYPHLNFHSNQIAANQALAVVAYYRFDEQCFVARPHAQMLYWKSAGEVPRNAMPGEDCSDVHPANVRAAQTDGAWKVVDGGNMLLDYGADQASANQAVSVIKAYHLARQCSVAAPDTTMSYWLAQ